MDVCSRPHSIQGNLVGRAAGDAHREHRVLHPAPPTNLRHEVSGSSRSGKPRSSHEQSCRRGVRLAPKADTAPDCATTRLEPPLKRGDSTRSTRATRATSGQRRGVPWIRGRARGSHSIAGIGTSSDRPPPGSSAPEATVFGETTANGGSVYQPQKGSSCCARHTTRGVRSRFTPLTPAENAAGKGALPGRTFDQRPSQERAEHVPRETRDTRAPAEALAASSSAASTDERRESNDPPGARARGQLQTLTRRIFPSGRGRPKGRQQTIG